MFWHKVPFGKKNFGDVLGPYLVHKLSGLTPVYTPLLHKGFHKDFFLTYARALYNRKLSFIEIFQNINYVTSGKKNLLITIGSVIDWYTNPDCDIWGAGIMFRKSKITNANFYAVRGKYSQLRLKELGYKVPQAIGDPALLTPLVYQPKSTKTYSVGVIPHFLHYEETVKKSSNTNILIINLLDPIEKVIDDVNSCQMIISSSLHGIIIGHAYQVPSLWLNLAKTHIGGDDIKFADYFSSVNLQEYKAFEIMNDSFDESFISEVQKLFEEKSELTLISSEVILKIQRDLITAAPFPILPKYQTLIENKKAASV